MLKAISGRVMLTCRVLVFCEWLALNVRLKGVPVQFFEKAMEELRILFSLVCASVTL